VFDGGADVDHRGSGFHATYSEGFCFRRVDLLRPSDSTFENAEIARAVFVCVHLFNHFSSFVHRFD
jgi:hypothetical protein